MKSIKLSIFLFSAAFVASCGFDNYDEPESMLSGNVVYNGENIQVRGTNETVQLELYQPGFELFTSIPIYVNQDGSFSALVFDGNYQLIARQGSGPWENSTDTIGVAVKGNTEITYEVVPFYTLSESNISLSGSTVTASFAINSVSPSQSINRAFLAVNRTQLVDVSANIAIANLDDPTPGEYTITLDLSDEVLEAQLLNARVGIEMNGGQTIYTPVVNIKDDF